MTTPLEFVPVHPVGEIPDRVLNSVFADISVHLPLVSSVINWGDWERAWAAAVGGRRLGSNKRLVDVTSGNVAWSLKSGGNAITGAGRFSAISSRLDVQKHRQVKDFSADVQRTGGAALEMWNDKIGAELAKSRIGMAPVDLDLRLLIVARRSGGSSYIFHERQLLSEPVGEYRWEINSQGNIQGSVGDEHRATFLRNGFKLQLHYYVRVTDPHVEYNPPVEMSLKRAMEIRPYRPIRVYRRSDPVKQPTLFE